MCNFRFSLLSPRSVSIRGRDRSVVGRGVGSYRRVGWTSTSWCLGSIRLRERSRRSLPSEVHRSYSWRSARQSSSGRDRARTCYVVWLFLSRRSVLPIVLRNARKREAKSCATTIAIVTSVSIVVVKVQCVWSAENSEPPRDRQRSFAERSSARSPVNERVALRHSVRSRHSSRARATCCEVREDFNFSGPYYYQRELTLRSLGRASFDGKIHLAEEIIGGRLIISNVISRRAKFRFFFVISIYNREGRVESNRVDRVCRPIVEFFSRRFYSRYDFNLVRSIVHQSVNQYDISQHRL